MQIWFAIMAWVMKMFAENLRAARNKKGYTQDDVAEHLGVKRQTYSSYERSKSVPDAMTLNKLSKFFDVSVDALLDSEEHKKAALSQSQDGVHGYDEDDTQLAPLIKILRNLKSDAIEQITPLIQDIHELPKNRKHASVENETAERIKKIASEARIILKDAGATTLAGDRIIKKRKHSELGKLINEMESLGLELVSKIEIFETENHSDLE
jgi:transcriptional regulator with XRE-family HTH domain